MLRKLILDVLKPHEPNIAVFSEKISGVDGIEGVNVSLYEIDRDVENVKVTIRGELDFDKIENKIKDIGASIHSVDEASAGEKLVEEAETAHERGSVEETELK